MNVSYINLKAYPSFVQERIKINPEVCNFINSVASYEKPLLRSLLQKLDELPIEELEYLEEKQKYPVENIPIVNFDGELLGFENFEFVERLNDRDGVDTKIFEFREQSTKDHVGDFHFSKRIFFFLDKTLGSTLASMKLLVSSQDKVEVTKRGGNNNAVTDANIEKTIIVAKKHFSDYRNYYDTFSSEVSIEV